jgi:hypothetical protein
MEKRDVLELIRLCGVLESSADNTGCTDDLTVVSKEALDMVTDWIVNRLGEN